MNKHKQHKHDERPSDVNQLAQRLVNLSTDTEPTRTGSYSSLGISQYMAEMGRKGGKIGGKRRLKTMTAEARSLVAAKAAKARWKKAKSKKAVVVSSCSSK
jgi:hypothetical protein